MRRTTAVLLTVLATACGGGATPAVAPAPATAPAATPAAVATAPQRPARGSANLITSAEIEAAGVDMLNALQLVERLRPMMMRARNQTAGSMGAGSTFGVIAYVDDVRLGELDALATVMRATVREIRYINATDATTRWGTGHSNGVIQVITKR